MNALTSSVTRIPLERPASIRRHLPSLDDNGWLLADYFVGEENAGLRHLFDESTIRGLHELSPIVLYGEQDTGKTALAITLAVRWSRMTRSRPLHFTTGKAFASEFVAALEIDDTNSFRQRYRRCKLLVIDDLETLGSNGATLTEMANTLDGLADASAPVIVSVDRLPATVDSLSSALISRLSAGFSTALHRPGSGTQRAILEAFANDFDDSLSVDDIHRFASSLDRSLRIQELKTIVTVFHQQRQSNGSVDLNVVGQLVRQLLDSQGLSIAGIAKVVARKMRVKLSDMRGSTREASIVRARGLAIVLGRRLTSTSLQQIGEFFGGRDHSTVLHAYRKTDKLLESDNELSKTLAAVQTELLK